MEKNSASKNGVHVLYKNLGETPYEAILRFKGENPEYIDEPMTYAGRLDPMAEGLLLVLSGGELSKKDEYLSLPKTYEFEVLWGFETDTLDLLGLVGESGKTKVESEEVNKYANSSIGKFEQRYPAYSSKPVQGPTAEGRASKPLFQWAREGRLSEIEVPSHEVEIYNADFNSRREISGFDLLQCIVVNLNLVKGDFRQIDILNKWKEAFNGLDNESFTIDKICVTVSSGFYVRQFVEDLAKSFSTKALAFSIKRTKIGDINISG